MSVLDVARAVAVNVGLERMDVLVASTEPENIELVQFISDSCEELARRVAWGDLTKKTTLTGDGTALTHDLPSDFDRLTGGACVVAGTVPVRALSQGEWSALTLSAGTPRYYLLQDNKIKFFPYLASGSTITVNYQARTWVGGITDQITADANTLLFDERLVEAATIARYRRQKGMSVEDYIREYEDMLKQRAEYDDRGRR